MSKVFATEMVDKKVLSTDGDNIGTLSNIVIDLRSGELIDLVVKLDMEAESIRAIKDYIVVDRKMG